MAREIRQEKEIKGIQNGKVEVKLSLFTDGIMRYIRNPKNFTRKLLEIINTLNNVSEYKLSLKNKKPPFIPMAHRLKNKDHGNTRTYSTLICTV